jgi:hypothetical protein
LLSFLYVFVPLNSKIIEPSCRVGRVQEQELIEKLEGLHFLMGDLHGRPCFDIQLHILLPLRFQMEWHVWPSVARLPEFLGENRANVQL